MRYRQAVMFFEKGVFTSANFERLQMAMCVLCVCVCVSPYMYYISMIYTYIYFLILKVSYFLEESKF